MCPWTSPATEPPAAVARHVSRALRAVRALAACGGVGLHLAGACAPVADPMLLAVRVNGVDGDDSLRVLRIGNRIAVDRNDWAALHLRPFAGTPVRFDGQDYLPLDTVPGLRSHVDGASQTLVIAASASAFAGVVLRMDTSVTVAAIPAAPGAYANYDVELQHTVVGGDPRVAYSASLQLDAGVSAFGGSLTSSGLLVDDGIHRRGTRLDTTWTQDNPKQMASLRAGDAVTNPGTWGRALRFGGMQWATDFSLQPGFLPFPLPSVHGEATLPSSVDVFVNNSRRLQSDLPAGPFDLNELPVVTGNGEVRLVVRDALGREQVITQPYFASPALLRPGLHAFSVEAGAVREDYALRSDHYGHVVAAATDRAGVTDSFTRELRMEWAPHLATAGATGTWLVPQVGVMTLGALASASGDGNGGALTATLTHQGRVWNGSVQLQRSSRDFAQLGVLAGDALRSQASATMGGSVGALPLGVGVVYQAPWNGPAQRLLSFNVGAGLGRFGSLGFYGLRDFTTGATTVSLSYSVSLDARTGVALGATRNATPGAASKVGYQMDVQRNLPEGEGVGWQVAAQDDDRAQAQLYARTPWADLNAGIARTNRQTDVRAGATGGAAWIDDSAFVTRRVDGTYAVVEVGDYPDVTILRDNHPVARTDQNGRALVAGLRGNEVNRVGVEAADLPLDAAVDALDLEFVAPSHAGVVLRLPIQRRRAASMRIVGADGTPLPPGTTLRMAGHDERFPVGFDGRTFVAGIRTGTLLRAHGPGADCGVTLVVPEGSADDLPDLGSVVCK